MKLIKTASGKTQVKLSKKEWENIGKVAGWDNISPLSTEDLSDVEEMREEEDWGMSSSNMSSGKRRLLDLLEEIKIKLSTGKEFSRESARTMNDILKDIDAAASSLDLPDELAWKIGRIKTYEAKPPTERIEREPTTKEYFDRQDRGEDWTTWHHPVVRERPIAENSEQTKARNQKRTEYIQSIIDEVKTLAI